jgi:1,5-anhydro-D-fructose reductase (1,5-anhydro-D-mannitol-forming)
MAKIRYGIIGCGLFAEKAIIPALQRSRNSELVALQKRSADAARAVAEKHNVPLTFTSPSDLVAHDDIDAVFIVSANGAHLGETVAAAESGKHVIVEKPMAVNAREAEQMVAVCEQRGVKLSVAHMIRMSPHAQRMREIVRSGMLGPVTYARADFIYDARLSHRGWLLDRRMAGGGPVFDVGVHCLDTLRFVLDDEVVSVSAELEPEPSEDRTEEVAEIALRFSRGTIAAIHCSYRAPIRRKQFEVVGEEAVLSAPDFTIGETTLPLTVSLGRNDEPSTPRVEHVAVPNLYVEEITHFSDCILTNREPLLSGQNGLANQRVLDLVLQSR